MHSRSLLFDSRPPIFKTDFHFRFVRQATMKIKLLAVSRDAALLLPWRGVARSETDGWKLAAFSIPFLGISIFAPVTFLCSLYARFRALSRGTWNW
jgi:hypothetical protein